VGIGGLGHLALKFARAMSAHVVAFTTSPKKQADALRFGAHEVIISTDVRAMLEQAWRFDLIIDTVPATYPMTLFLNALKFDGTLCTLGIPESLDFDPLMLTLGRRRIASSGVGGSNEIREMLDFCRTSGLVADVEIIHPEEINRALERLAQRDVPRRFVLKMD
jgi:alcohol dehydrogenase (NADP+)